MRFCSSPSERESLSTVSLKVLLLADVGGTEVEEAGGEGDEVEEAGGEGDGAEEAGGEGD